MKLSVLVITLFSLLLTSCNNVDGNKKASSTNEIKSGIVNQINTDLFLKLVYDYKKNPNTLIFEGTQPCIIDFYADWCRPCKMVGPIMEELAAQYKGKVTFYKINIDQEKELSQNFNIQSIPALLYIPVNGQPQLSVGLSSKESYIQQIQTLLIQTQLNN